MIAPTSFASVVLIDADVLPLYVLFAAVASITVSSLAVMRAVAVLVLSTV